MPFPTIPSPKRHSPEEEPTPFEFPTEEPTPEGATPDNGATEALPPPVEFSGIGSLSTGLFQLPAPVSRVVITHDGEGPFALNLLSSLDPSGRTLLETEGFYRGSAFLSGDEDFFFNVETEGSWSVTVEAIPTDSPPGDVLIGDGDLISNFFEPPAEDSVPYVFRHSGKMCFGFYCVVKMG
ncbi:MAG: hypothetical protein HC893_00690 [Chloroflexaceae bacterium]|nr:hypothetical protein [Chloroflexaceae bacterium]